jgi:hypothetical protein
MGGPVYRWIIAFYLGSKECCRNVDDKFKSPNLYVPVITMLAIALILIASFLFISTLLQLCQGDLTIDVEIRKSVIRLNTVAARQRAQRYFWIPMSSEGESTGVVVACEGHIQPYDFGNWKDNLKAFLW